MSDSAGKSGGVLAKTSLVLAIILAGTVYWQSNRLADLETKLVAMETGVSGKHTEQARAGADALATDATPAGQLGTSFGGLVNALSPAVVNIAAKPDAAAQLRAGPRRPGENASALGSGFVIDPTGFVVTNHHVIADASEIEVIFTDGTTLPAELVGQDPETDIAVLKVTPEGSLPYVNFGNSDSASVGDWVIAIGNPFGLGGSVSAGIISAFGRGSIRPNNQGMYDHYIQTDAAINRGNSGGPLFNLAGEVIGINTAIISPTGGSVGIGFSIPANRAKIVVDQLRQYGRPVRGWLGLQIRDVDEPIAEAQERPDTFGVFVDGVLENQPAAAGGVQAKDIILKYNGEEIKNTRDFLWKVARSQVGRPVDVDVWRDGEVKTLSVVVGEREERFETTRIKDERVTVDGILLGALNKSLRNQFGVDDDVEGVIVLQIEDGAPAADSNLRPGDIVVEVKDQKISSPAELRDAFEAVRGKGRNSVLVRLWRAGKLRYEGVPLARE